MHVGRGERIRTSDPLLPKQLTRHPLLSAYVLEAIDLSIRSKDLADSPPCSRPRPRSASPRSTRASRRSLPSRRTRTRGATASAASSRRGRSTSRTGKARNQRLHLVDVVGKRWQCRVAVAHHFTPDNSLANAGAWALTSAPADLAARISAAAGLSVGPISHPTKVFGAVRPLHRGRGPVDKP